MKSLCMMSQPKLYKYLYKYLCGKYGHSKVITDIGSEWMIAIGEDPLIVCAHLDTVFPEPPINIFVDKEAQVMWAPKGLGADDRAGVYAILTLLMDGYKPTVIFTTGEEIGCKGASSLVYNFPNCPVSGIKCIIQLDRRNGGEAVYYACKNKKFEDWISMHGFMTEHGTFTDISVICPKWGIAGVNLSVGYYNEHTKQEFLRYNDLEYTLGHMRRIIVDLRELDEEFIYIKDPEQAGWYDYVIPSCDFCGTPLEKIYYQKFDGGYTYTLCPDCMKYYDNIIGYSEHPQDSDEEEFHIIPPI